MAAQNLPQGLVRPSSVLKELGQNMKNKGVKSLYCCSEVCVRVGGVKSQPFSDEEEGTCAGPSFDVGSF